MEEPGQRARGLGHTSALQCRGGNAVAGLTYKLEHHDVSGGRSGQR